MWKFGFLVALCSFCAVYGQIDGRQLIQVPSPINQIAVKSAAECVKETGVSQQISDDFFNIQVKPDEDTKKFVYCFGRKINNVDEDGLLNENFITLFDGHDLKEEAHKVRVKCNIKKNTKYDTALESVDCFYKTSPVLPVL